MEALFKKLITTLATAYIVLVVVFACVLQGDLSANTFRRTDGQPTVSIIPPLTTIAPGEQCTLQVFVDDAVDSLSCMEVNVTFDSVLVQCILAQKGELYEGASFPTFFDWDHVTSDTVTAVACVLGHRSYILAPGELVRFVFEGLEIGTTPVTITSVNLTDIDRNALNTIVAGDAEIRISISTGDNPDCPVPGRMINYPNPCKPTTRIELWLQAGPLNEHFSVSIYAPDGKHVKTLHEGPLSAERTDFTWDGTNGRGIPVSAGIYFAVADAASMRLIRKLVLVR